MTKLTNFQEKVLQKAYENHVQGGATASHIQGVYKGAIQSEADRNDGGR